MDWSNTQTGKTGHLNQAGERGRYLIPNVVKICAWSNFLASYSLFYCDLLFFLPFLLSCFRLLSFQSIILFFLPFLLSCFRLLSVQSIILLPSIHHSVAVFILSVSFCCVIHSSIILLLVLSLSFIFIFLILVFLMSVIVQSFFTRSMSVLPCC